MTGRRAWGGFLFSTLATFAAACGGEDPVEADPTVAPFVGTWEADSLTMTSVADTSVHDNLIAQGGGFTIVVEPSGQYTATLESAIGTAVEIGDLDVLGSSSLELNRTYPPPEKTDVLDYRFVGSDRLTLEGLTGYDFNRDDTNETARGYIELQRQ